MNCDILGIEGYASKTFDYGCMTNQQKGKNNDERLKKSRNRAHLKPKDQHKTILKGKFLLQDYT